MLLVNEIRNMSHDILLAHFENRCKDIGYRQGAGVKISQSLTTEVNQLRKEIEKRLIHGGINNGT